jgi:hypothetical protein
MWDSTDLAPDCAGVLSHGPWDPLLVESELPTALESHICQNRADMGHPSIGNTERIASVITHGRLLRKPDLDALMLQGEHAAHAAK